MTEKLDVGTGNCAENLSQLDTRESRCDLVLVTVDAESFDHYSQLFDQPPCGEGFARLMNAPSPWRD